MIHNKYKFEIDCFTVGDFGTNLYIISDKNSREAILMDPGQGSEFILDHVLDKNLKLKYIVNTHGHFDHAFNNTFFKNETNACLCCHEKEADLLKILDSQGSMYGITVPSSPEPDMLLRENDILELNQNISFRIIHAPGHSPGSICLYSEGYLFCGDVLFEGSIGRTDLPGGNTSQLLRSIREKLFILPGNTMVLPGHGANTTIGREKEHNPFLNNNVIT